MQPNHQNKTNKLMFLLLREEESVGPISTVHSHRYCAKKIASFKRAHNSDLIDIFIIVIVAAMKLISEGYKFLRDRRSVPSE